MGTSEFKPEVRSVAHFERVNVCITVTDMSPSHCKQQVEFAPGSSDIFATCSSPDIRIWQTASNKELLRIVVPNQVEKYTHHTYIE
jgi:hypothetical protein